MYHVIKLTKTGFYGIHSVDNAKDAAFVYAKAIELFGADNVRLITP